MKGFIHDEGRDVLRENLRGRHFAWCAQAAGRDGRWRTLQGQPIDAGPLLGRAKGLAIDDHGTDGQAPGDWAAELKRLRRENDILKQERDVLKRVTVFFAKEGSR